MRSIIKKLVPRWVINLYHWKMAVLANIIYGFPSKGMRVIGITGTNGKTTTSFMVRSILMAAGRQTGMLTTVSFSFGDQLVQNQMNMTTISPFLMQKYLKQMRRAGCTDVVLETTSHAIDQYRIWGIHYEVLALTNITHDHLDYHGTMAQYVATKKKLFAKPHRVSVINNDDPAFDDFWHLTGMAGRKISYGLEHRGVDVTARKVLTEGVGTLLTLVVPQGQVAVDLHLPGEFNVSNALCAAAIALGLDIPLNIIKEGLETVTQVPGRMEQVTLPDIKTKLPFTVILDYAHTPDALEKVYKALRGSVKGRIISVLGATGDRDKTKRPILGALAGRFADIAIITDEEPYTEDPKEILEAVAIGVPRGATKERPKKVDETFFKVTQRLGAIEKAIDLAEKGDLVLVTGMGDQSYRVVGREHVPWSDREAIQSALRQRALEEKR
jgi:UDP-N-acetylmuramoyl-L-alanyl-D-glutamate--2,6-diaminopimelate ligase